MKLVKKSNQLNTGYVYAPYIMMSSSSIIIENSKRTNRKIKIGKIFSFDVYTNLLVLLNLYQVDIPLRL